MVEPTSIRLQDAHNAVVHSAKNRLRGSSHLFLRHVDCDYYQGRLKLHGKVPSYYLKQLAQSLVADVQGVDSIENRLAVVSSAGLSDG